MLHLRHLETDVTQACQLSCVACNHLVPMWRKAGPWFARPAQVDADLSHLSTFVHADRWGALGGEPLLHKQLVDILAIVRATHIADAIEVWTNGLLLPQMSESFWQAFDILVLSIYPGKHTDASLAWIADACAAHGIRLEHKDERQRPNFRTLLEPTPTDPPTTATKFAQCFFRHFSRSASYGYFFTCCCAPHMPMLLQGRPFGTDGVPIAGLTEAGLSAYLTRTEPLGCCTLCAGRETAQPIPWTEERNPLQWLHASAGLV